MKKILVLMFVFAAVQANAANEYVDTFKREVVERFDGFASEPRRLEAEETEVVETINVVHFDVYKSDSLIRPANGYFNFIVSSKYCGIGEYKDDCYVYESEELSIAFEYEEGRWVPVKIMNGDFERPVSKQILMDAVSDERDLKDPLFITLLSYFD